MIYDILSLFILPLIMIGARCSKSFNDGYISIETSNMWRGFFAIIILLHHMFQRVSVGVITPWFTEAGAIAVAMFFFFSGYGVQKSYMKKGTVYTDKFLVKRLPKILIPFVVLSLIYWLIYTIEGFSYSIVDLLYLVARGTPILNNSWYIFDIMLFYIAYYLIVRISKNNKHIIILSVVYYVLRTVIVFLLNFDNCWIKSTHIVVLGIIWAVYEDKILKTIQRHYKLFMPLFAALFFIMYSFLTKTSVDGNLLYSLVIAAVTILNCIIFVTLILMISMKIQIGNRVLAFLGKISLEIYLVQGLFISGLRNEKLWMSNSVVWVILSVSGTLLLSYILNKFFNKIMGFYTKLIK